MDATAPCLLPFFEYDEGEWHEMLVMEGGAAQQRNTFTPPSLLNKVHEFVTTKLFSKKEDENLSESGEAECAQFPETISLLSFNVWFDALGKTLRFEALLSLLEELKVDVVGLQEMTTTVTRMLLEHPYVQKTYYSSIGPNDLKLVSPYGCVLLVKRRLPLRSLRLIPWKSRMYRYGLVADLCDEQQRTLMVSTVHLESLGNRTTRAIQMETMENFLRTADFSVMMGDFNITATGPYKNEEEDASVLKIMGEYVDAWFWSNDAETRSFTFDTVKNTMIAAQRKEQARYDRVLVRNATVESCRMVGDEPIDEEPANKQAARLFISDHFGLHTVIRLV